MSARTTAALVAVVVAVGVALAAGLAAQRVAAHPESGAGEVNPGYVVDSILPLDEDLRRLYAVAGTPVVTRLEGGASDMKTLLTAFTAAVDSRDSVALRDLAVSFREFAYLVYPESPYTRPPYRQSPAVTWQLLRSGSESGLRRLLSRVAAGTVAPGGIHCAGDVEDQGRNRFHVNCVAVRVRADGSRGPQRLFGSVIERDGLYKFVSYANDF